MNIEKTNKPLLSKEELDQTKKKLNNIIGTSAPMLDGAGGIIMIKELDSRYAYCNQGFLDLLQFNKESELLEKYDTDLPWADFAKIYQSYDQQVFTDTHNLNTIVPMYIKNGSFIISNTLKKPIFDNDGTLLGLIAYSRIIDNKSMNETLISLQEQDKRITATSNKNPASYLCLNSLSIKLTQREAECLFFLLRGKTAKEIGRFLDISYRTVEIYCQKLKDKFKCHSKSELIAKAINSGYMEIIPPSLNIDKIKASYL